MGRFTERESAHFLILFQVFTSNLFTIAGLAFPFVARITCPTKKAHQLFSCLRGMLPPLWGFPAEFVQLSAQEPNHQIFGPNLFSFT